MIKLTCSKVYYRKIILNKAPISAKWLPVALLTNAHMNFFLGVGRGEDKTFIKIARWVAGSHVTLCIADIANVYYNQLQVPLLNKIKIEKLKIF